MTFRTKQHVQRWRRPCQSAIFITLFLRLTQKMALLSRLTATRKQGCAFCLSIHCKVCAGWQSCGSIHLTSPLVHVGYLHLDKDLLRYRDTCVSYFLVAKNTAPRHPCLLRARGCWQNTLVGSPRTSYSSTLYILGGSAKRRLSKMFRIIRSTAQDKVQNSSYQIVLTSFIFHCCLISGLAGPF